MSSSAPETVRGESPPPNSRWRPCAGSPAMRRIPASSATRRSPSGPPSTPGPPPLRHDRPARRAGAARRRRHLRPSRPEGPGRRGVRPGALAVFRSWRERGRRLAPPRPGPNLRLRSHPTVRATQAESAVRPAAEGDPPRDSERLFVAVPLPDPVRDELSGLAEPLRGVSWTRPAQLHLTLRFIGEVPAGMIERIEERLASIRVESFIIPVEGVGAFPPKGPPRVIWAGVGLGHP